MLAYITTAISEKNEYGQLYLKEIENILKEVGVKTYKSIQSIDDNIEHTKSSEEKSFEVLDNIKKCDIFIGEMSLPSQTLGFQLAYALNISKICLYIYPEDSKGKPNPPLLGNPSRLLTIKSYNKDNLRDILISFIIKAENKLKSDRITFVSTKQINEYLRKKSLIENTAKGEILRKIIEEYIQKNPIN
jgi:hypothetical protein